MLIFSHFLISFLKLNILMILTYIAQSKLVNINLIRLLWILKISKRKLLVIKKTSYI